MAHNGEDFYELYAQSVYRYLFLLIGEADTAEELTQETFYQALEKHKYIPVEKVRLKCGYVRLPKGCGLRNWNAVSVLFS